MAVWSGWQGKEKGGAMALREIIVIDEGKCDGCGACALGCPEGALQVIEGKARLVGESLCDGLGACIGECPRGAIGIEKREARAYDEDAVMEGMAKLGPAVIAAHLEHLARHGQSGLEATALAWLAAHGQGDPRPATPTAAAAAPSQGSPCASPGSAPRRFAAHAAAPRPSALPVQAPGTEASSALSSWPIQLRLVNPAAPQFEGSRLLVAADCCAFSLGSFHATLLEGRSLVIACPKLDDREGYAEKLEALIGRAESVEVAIMEVPCCGGLLKLVADARDRAKKGMPITVSVVGIEGGVIGRKMI